MRISIVKDDKGFAVVVDGQTVATAKTLEQAVKARDKAHAERRLR